MMRIVELGAEAEVVEVIVGLPVGLSGSEGPSATKVRMYAADLAAVLAPVPVRLVDERLSTVSAQQAYRSRGISVKKSRKRIDAAAAAVILQSALDSERASGCPPGEPALPSRGSGTQEHGRGPGESLGGPGEAPGTPLSE